MTSRILVMREGLFLQNILKDGHFRNPFPKCGQIGQKLADVRVEENGADVDLGWSGGLLDPLTSPAYLNVY